MENFWDLHIAYVRECEKLNWANDIDPHHYKMEWHHILPQCLFGDQPIGAWLTLRQHAIASCLQSIAFKKWSNCGRFKALAPVWLWEKSVKACRGEFVEQGKKFGETALLQGLGIHGATPEQRSKWGREGALKAMQMGVGCVSASSEQLSEWSRMSNGVTGRRMKEEGRGIFAPGMQALGGKTTQEKGVGVFALTKEQQRELGKKTTSQRWRCLETGHISTPGGLSRFQKARDIDTSLRERLE